MRGRRMPRPRPVFATRAAMDARRPHAGRRVPPSRQNTNTGVVTPQMYDAVFRTVRRIAALDERAVRSGGRSRPLFFLYVLAIRTYDVATTFLMLGEQTRDWTIALGGITDLPLTGAPSTAGGRGFGPVVLLAAVARTRHDRAVHGQPAARRRHHRRAAAIDRRTWLLVALVAAGALGVSRWRCAC